MKIEIIKKIKNIKFPKIILSDNNYVFGIKTINSNDLTKFIINLHIYNNEFNYINNKNIEILCDDNISLLIWDIIINDDEYIFI